MTATPFQKKRSGGKSEALFTGLAAKVHRVLLNLDNVQEITCNGVHGYKGTPKVKIPSRWAQHRVLPIVVCDGTHGEREIHVKTLKPGAIARILRKRLEADGHMVCCR